MCSLSHSLIAFKLGLLISFSNSVVKLIDVLNSFMGSYNQEVPSYSAVKINGKKLYDYARNNIDVKLPKRDVCIKEIEWCRKNKEAIVKKANKLYYLVQKPNCSSMLKKRCNDFKKLEKVLEKLLQKK